MSSLLNDIKNELSDTFDVKYRSINIGNSKAHLVYIDNICDSKYMSEFIIEPLINYKKMWILLKQ